jgi:ABC-type Fe3+ transport system permease subunit
VGLVMPVIEQLHYSGAQMAALSICIAGGSIVVSHVNDAGFWLFGKFTGATEAQTLKTWTLMETILGTTGAIVGQGMSDGAWPSLLDTLLYAGIAAPITAAFGLLIAPLSGEPVK